MAPGEAGSRMDQQFCADISRIADALNRLANCAEADEKRKRRQEVEAGEVLAGRCEFGDDNPVVMMLNGERFCREHVDEGFARMQGALRAVQRGFADLDPHDLGGEG